MLYRVTEHNVISRRNPLNIHLYSGRRILKTHTSTGFLRRIKKCSALIIINRMNFLHKIFSISSAWGNVDTIILSIGTTRAIYNMPSSLSPSLSLSLSLSLRLSLTHTHCIHKHYNMYTSISLRHTHTHTHMEEHMHTHTHTCLMAMEMRTELTDDSICTLSFSFLLTTTGVISNSLLLLLYTYRHKNKKTHILHYGHIWKWH